MRERCRASGLLVGVALASCGAGAPAHAPSTEPRKAEAPPAPAARVTNVAAPVASAPPAKVHLTQDEARRRMLELINRDRATQKLPPVLLDEGPAQAAAQRHAEDMARRGFLGHWGTDGSVPEQRYTEAGGADFVQENALCFTDEKERTLDPDPRVDADAIARAESMFFDEVPPNDGHRRNILKAQHLRVGIGVAQPVGTPRERAVPCFTQEFVDAYGTYAPLPGRVKVGATLRVSGEVSGRASFAGVGLARIDMPRPIPVAELNKRRSYAIPAPYQTYWPAGFKTPIPVSVDGGRFTVDVPVSDGKKPGLYEVSVWAKIAPSSELVMVSLRTLRAE